MRPRPRLPLPALVVALLVPLLVALLVALPQTTAGAKPASAKPGKLVIQVLSNRADLISAGDALVAVRLPTTVRPRRCGSASAAVT